MTTFYDFSGGMESAAMLVVDRQRIADGSAIVRWADTGKQFPEMASSLEQIQSALGVTIVTVAPRISFDQYLFERGGMLRKGMNDCSRRMKRGNLSRHMKSFSKPYEVNLGYNNSEDVRAAKFVARNERTWLHWRFPLIESDISREETHSICREAGFTILCEMYAKMERFDCFWCPNQKVSQALKVVEHYPELASEWIAAEERKGHSFLRTPLKILGQQQGDGLPESPLECACFGGDVDVADEIEQELA